MWLNERQQNRKKLQGSKTGWGADCKQQRGAKANSRAVAAEQKKKTKQQDEWATSSRITEQQRRHGSEWEWWLWSCETGSTGKGRQRGTRGLGNKESWDLRLLLLQKCRGKRWRRAAASAAQLRRFSKQPALAAVLPSAPLPFPGGNCCGVEGRGRRRRKIEEEEGEDEAGGWGERGVRPAQPQRSLRSLVAGQPWVSPQAQPRRDSPACLASLFP